MLGFRFWIIQLLSLTECFCSQVYQTTKSRGIDYLSDMPDTVEIVKEASESKSEHVYINGAFAFDPLHIGNNVFEKPGPVHIESSHASMPTKSVLTVIRQSRWMLPLVYTHIWLSAAFSLMQPYFPPLVSIILMKTPSVSLQCVMKVYYIGGA